LINPDQDEKDQQSALYLRKSAQSAVIFEGGRKHESSVLIYSCYSWFLFFLCLAADYHGYAEEGESPPISAD
jgi:hypothetical protein